MLHALLSMLSAATSRESPPTGAASGDPVGGESADPTVDLETAVRRVEAVAEDVVDDETTRAALVAGVEEALSDLEDPPSLDAEVAIGDREVNIALDRLVEGFPHPVYVFDNDHTVLAYNTAAKRLLGLDDDHDAFLGRDGRETIAAASYTGGRRHHTLADKVVENPHDAGDVWDVTDARETFPYCDRPVYTDTSVTKNTRGESTHISFLAVPLFDERGDLDVVVELIQDRSEEVTRQRTVASLVTEVTDTLSAIGGGDLGARADFTDDHGVIEED